MTLKSFKDSKIISVDSKTTLGQKYLDAYDPDEKGLETRNVVEEYGKDRFLPVLEDVIASHRDFAPFYYIWIVNQELPEYDAKKINFVIRKSKPTPKWETVLFSYDNKSNDLRLEWVLPTAEGGAAMLENKDGWDPLLIKSLVENLPDLQRQQAAMVSQATSLQDGPGAFLTGLTDSENNSSNQTDH